MGFLDRLLGTTRPQPARHQSKQQPAKPTVRQTPTATAPKPASVTPKPAEEIAAPVVEPVVETVAPVAEEIVEVVETAQEEAVETVETVQEEAVEVVETVQEEAVEAVEIAQEKAVETVETVQEEAPAAADEVSAWGETPAWSEGVQKRLDTYFARLRQEFPDGTILRLNTAHKKLAERGAQLRRLTGYEGRLDEFFALGGFTYQRSVGGRPTLSAEQTASVEDRLREMFPDDVPTVLAVKQADPRLYLDLRAAARKQGCTAGEYLQQFKDE